MVGSQGLRVALGVVVAAVFVRFLGDDGFGAVTTVAALLAVAMRVVDAGLAPALVADLATGPGEHSYRRIVRLRRRLAVICAIGAVAVLTSTSLIADARPVAGLLEALVAIAVFTFPFRTDAALFAARRLNRFPAVISIVVPVVFAMATLPLAAWFGLAALPWILTCVVVRESASALLPWWWARRRGISPQSNPSSNPQSNPSVDAGDVIVDDESNLHHRPLAVLVAATLFSSLYFHVDVFMLGWMRSPADVGIYGVALRVFQPFAVLVGLLAAPVVPLIARGRGATLGLGTLLVAGTAMPLAGVFLAASDIATLITGESSHTSADVMPWMAWSVPAIVVGTVASIHLITARRERTWMVVTGVGLIVNVVTNLWWIPTRGVIGAARATLVTEVVVALSALIAARGHGIGESSRRNGAIASSTIHVVGPIVIAFGLVRVLDPVSPWRLPLIAILAVGAAGIFTFGPGAGRIRRMLEEEVDVVHDEHGDGAEQRGAEQRGGGRP